MLNDVLNIAKNMEIFGEDEKNKFREFAIKLAKLGRRYDCNNG
jgi:hypothetical protein